MCSACPASSRASRHPPPRPGRSTARAHSATRYAAAELGSKGIRVHAISPGPIATRAARCGASPGWSYPSTAASILDELERSVYALACEGSGSRAGEPSSRSP
ncbi:MULTISPECIES: SDR family oxidoreductase [Sphingomonadales]|uniref:SDR family oxidoreductase n=1 Tax=Sphingomonadales TaxID=204457 RepID=UPI0020CF47E1|nr:MULTISPECIES: SDR family oxidoreductase [unclassified Sphingobium]